MQENAAVLLGKHAKDAQWHRMMSPYWDSLPGTDSGLLCRHLFTEHEAAMLQSASMVRFWLAASLSSSAEGGACDVFKDPPDIARCGTLYPWDAAGMSRGIG